MTINTPAKEAERLGIEGMIFGDGEVRPPRRVHVAPPKVPAEDKPLASRKWLKRYGLVVSSSGEVSSTYRESK